MKSLKYKQVKSTQLLHIKLNNKYLGRLLIGNNGNTLFEYDSQWLTNGFSISPFYLPLKAGVFEAKHEPFSGLFGVFADSMPDGWGNLLLDRFLMKQGIQLSSLNVLDRLAFVGKNGMGALSYEPDKSFISKENTVGLDAVANQVAEILSERADLPTVKSLLEQTGSSGGARPKVLIKHEDSSWMVKFPSSTDPENIGKKEFFYSLLAKQCGIDMPETKLLEGKYFAIQLFDRKGIERFHMHSASGLLHASHRYPSLDYLQLAKATMALTKNVKELGKLLTIMVFNVAIGNKDDHAKNFSYLYKNNNWILSPAYDLLKSDGFGGEHATSVLGAGNPNRKDMLKLANEIGYPLKKMKIIIDRVYDNCAKTDI